MGSKLSGTQIAKLDTLGEARRKFHRVRKLIEQAAVTPKAAGDLMRQCQRTSSEVGRLLTNAGFGALAGYASDLAALIKRTSTVQSNLRPIREMVAQTYAGFDRAERAIEQES
jgi:hypothetical protein